VGEHIGFLWALLILIAVSGLGPFIVARVGIGVLADAQEKLADGAVPTRELLDGVLVLVGGVMICVPGFISDAIGLLLMTGPARHLLIRLGAYRLVRPIETRTPGRWRVVDVRSRPMSSDTPTPPGVAGRTIEPGRGSDN
jgi:UPF0716 protein FxsA